MSINYSEQILDSVQILTAEALKKVTFDRTEICEIISQDQQMPTKYLVSNDNLKFYAYSDDEDKEYKEGSKVYVRIPNGDYNLEKVITGRYSADESTQLLYTNPFDDLVSSKSLQILEGEGNHLTLTINSSVQQNNTITKPISFSYNKSTPFNYLGFDCGFDTMSLYGQYKGTYKVFIELLDNNQTPLIECDLYSTDLYGNPYSLVPNLTFQHLFNFDQDLDITLIKYARITLQDCGGFGFEGSREIFLTSATLYFGYAKDEIFSIGEKGDSDSLTLVLKSDPTTSGMEYSKSPHENLNRTVFLEWNYNDSLGIPHIFNEDQLPDLDLFHEYHIYWMQYTNNINHKVSGLPDEYCWKWKQVKTDTDKAFRCDFELNNNYANDQYRVVIKYKIDKEDKDYQYIQSDGLIFKSKDQTTTVETASQVRESLRIVLKDSNGTYNYYGLDGHITDLSLTGPYRIGFEFYDSMSATDIESVEWFFPPEENSMIVFDSLENNTGIYETFEECDAYFNIKRKCSGAEMNNTIRCRVQLQSQEREGSITLNFGEASTSGANYGLNIDFIGNKNCLYALGDGIEDKLRVQATLTKDNEIIPDLGGADIAWEWVNASSEDFPIQCLPAGQTATLSYRGSKVEVCYSILKATINDYPLDNGLTSTLCAFLQVPIAKGYDVEANNYSYISGPSRVIYGPDNKTYTKSEQGYNLYIKNNNNPVPNVYWRLETAETTNIPQLEGSLPITVWSEDYSTSMQFFSNGCTLLPANYNSKELPAINVVAYSSASLGATVLWSQPLLIMSNKWYSSAINEWNGTVEVDENGTKGSIKAPYFLAGLKDDNNTFSGVVIGDLYSADVDVKRNTTGIYGFKQGQQRFQLSDDGYFFVGDNKNSLSFNKNGSGKFKVGEWTLINGGFDNYGKSVYLSKYAGMNSSGENGDGRQGHMFWGGAGKWVYRDYWNSAEKSWSNVPVNKNGLKISPYMSYSEAQSYSKEVLKQSGVSSPDMSQIFAKMAELFYCPTADEPSVTITDSNVTQTYNTYSCGTDASSGSFLVTHTGEIRATKLTLGNIRPTDESGNSNFTLDIRFPSINFNPALNGGTFYMNKGVNEEGNWKDDPNLDDELTNAFFIADKNGLRLAGDIRATAGKIGGWDIAEDGALEYIYTGHDSITRINPYALKRTSEGLTDEDNYFILFNNTQLPKPDGYTLPTFSVRYDGTINSLGGIRTNGSIICDRLTTSALGVRGGLSISNGNLDILHGNLDVDGNLNVGARLKVGDNFEILDGNLTVIVSGTPYSGQTYNYTFTNTKGNKVTMEFKKGILAKITTS